MVEVIIYGKTQCPYCGFAKEFFKERGIDFTYHSVDDDAAFMELEERTGMSTVPQIFINGKLLGGWLKLKELIEKGEIDGLLTE